jgi:hypothetical protein
MKNIQTYDEFLNEGIISDIKQKLNNWWSSFQNKQEVITKLCDLTDAGRLNFIPVYLLLMILYWVPSIKEWSQSMIGNPVNTAYWIAIIGQFVSTILTFPLGRWRSKLIKREMEQLRFRYANHEFLENYYALLGNKKDINAALERLKNDGVLEDKHILQTDEITILDMSGTIRGQEARVKPELKDDSIHKALDPYGEEDWDDKNVPARARNPLDVDPKVYMRDRVVKDLADIYDIQFKRISDIFDWEIRRPYIPIYTQIKKKEEIRRSEADYQRDLRTFNAPPVPVVDLGIQHGMNPGIWPAHQRNNINIDEILANIRARARARRPGGPNPVPPQEQEEQEQQEEQEYDDKEFQEWKKAMRWGDDENN